MSTNSPLAKRTKLNNNNNNDSNKDELAIFLEEMNNDIQQALHDTNAIKQHFGTQTLDNEPALSSGDDMVAEMNRLRGEMKRLISELRFIASHLTDVVLNTIKSQLFDMLPRDSFLFLAATSSAMFKMNAYPVYIPSSDVVTTFKHLKPNTIVCESNTGNVPSHVTRLCFADRFNQALHLLPSTITHITFGDSFNHTVNRVLPASLIHLTFGDKYNSSVRYLPNNITHLTFGRFFNLPVDFLPPSISHLIFSRGFTHPLNNPPPALQELRLFSNHPVDHLPNTIHTLTISTKTPINKLPASLTVFAHMSHANNLNCPLPPSLTDLHLSGVSPTIDLSSLPLKRLKIDTTTMPTPNLANFPTTLHSLHINGPWDLPLDSLPLSLRNLTLNSFELDQPLNRLPASLTHLTLGDLMASECSHLLDNIPASLTEFNIDFEYDHPLHFINNPPITHLNLGDHFNEPVDELPASITHLTLGFNFDQPVNALPLIVTHLTFGYSFNQEVAHLPQKLTHLSFGFYFDQYITTLPASITHLKLGAMYSKKIYTLPSSLHTFHISHFTNLELSSCKLLPLPPSIKQVVMLVVDHNTAQYYMKEYAEEQVEEKVAMEYALMVTTNYWNKKTTVEWISMDYYEAYAVSSWSKF